jgi:hypothetical protein
VYQGNHHFASSYCKILNLRVPSQNLQAVYCGATVKRTRNPPQSVSGKRIQCFEGVPEDFKNEGGKPALIILDDLLIEVYSKQVCILFTKGCHHTNISVLLITQNQFHQITYCRHISLNTKYLVILKNTRDKQQFTHLARQVYPENSKSQHEAYLDATDKAHGYLVLDFAQDTDDKLMYRTHIFLGRTPNHILCSTNRR